MKLLATLLTVVVAATLTVLFWPGGEEPQAISTRPAVTPATVLAGDGEDVTLVAPGQARNRPQSVGREQVEADERASAEIAVWGRLEGEFVEVVVLRAADRTPVANAAVHVRLDDEDEPEGLDSGDLWREDLDLYLARFTERFPTDATGTARVPADRGGLVYALAEGLVGSENFNRRDDSVEVLVHPDRTLRVHVVGPGGPLVDAEVGLAGEARRGRGRGRARVFSTRRTDGSGYATFTHLPALLRMPWMRGVQDFKARLEMPLSEPAETDLPSLEELEESQELVHEVLLEAPATGAVVVRIVDAAGAPFPALGEVELGWFGDDLEQELQEAAGDMLELVDEIEDESTRELVNGVARFSHVGVGLELGILAEFEQERDPVGALVLGPVVDGAEELVELTVGPRAAMLVGRLVDDQGEAQSEREFRADLSHPDGREGWREETDAEGRFRLRLDPDEVPEGEWTLSIRPDRDDDGDDEERDPAGLEVMHESLFAPRPGENDLGDVVCLPRPLLVAGKVVDENGEGLGDVEVRVGLELVSTEDPNRTRFWDRADLAPGTDREVDSEDDGSFRMYGRVGDLGRWDDWTARTAVQARGDGITNAEPVLFEPGSEGVRLEVLVAGRIEGTLDLEDEDLLDVTRLWVERGVPGDIERRWVRRDGRRFEAENLRPGPWDVVVRLEDEPGEVARVQGVEVPRGGVAEDSRLEPLALPDLRRFRIHVESSVGQTISGIRVQRRLPGETAWSDDEGMRMRSDDAGRYFEFVTANPGLDLRLTADEHRPEVLAHVAEDRIAVLSGGPEVELRIDSGIARVLGEDLALSVRLNRRGLTQNVNFGEFREEREARTKRVPETGDYNVAAWIYSTAEDQQDRRRRRTVEGVQVRGPVTIAEVQNLQSYTLRIDPNALAAAIERLEQRLAEQN